MNALAIRKIFTDGRHNLEKDATQGHASTSVYTKTGILIPKINIFGKKKLAHYEWEPTNYVLARAKSTAYKNLQARKKTAPTISS